MGPSPLPFRGRAGPEAMIARRAAPAPCDRPSPSAGPAPAVAAEPVDATRLDGYLELDCASDASGRSYLARQRFRVPFHISKPYWNDHALVVQVVNPTAGLFAGDTLRLQVRVGPGARLHLTTPSAGRVHTTQGTGAEVCQEFFVARGGWLEFQPALLIPQRKCRYRQKTDIDVEEGGQLFFFEAMAPGRVAHGESFNFSEVDWACNLRHQNKLVARERFTLRPDDTSLAPLRSPFPGAYFATGYLVSHRLEDRPACWEQIREWTGDSALVGISRLAAAVWSLRILARNSIALTEAVQSIRRLLADALPPLRSQARRL